MCDQGSCSASDPAQTYYVNGAAVSANAAHNGNGNWGDYARTCLFGVGVTATSMFTGSLAEAVRDDRPLTH